MVQKKGTEKDNEEERRPTDAISILQNIVKQSKEWQAPFILTP